MKDSPLTALKEQFSGPTAVAFNTTDAVALAKALTKFAKDVPAVTFKGAMLNGQIVPAEQIQTIANLPSRDELIASCCTSCSRRSAAWRPCCSANIRNLAVVLDQIAKRRRDRREAEQTLSRIREPVAR